MNCFVCDTHRADESGGTPWKLLSDAVVSDGSTAAEVLAAILGCYLHDDIDRNGKICAKCWTTVSSAEEHRLMYKKFCEKLLTVWERKKEPVPSNSESSDSFRGNRHSEGNESEQGSCSLPHYSRRRSDEVSVQRLQPTEARGTSRGEICEICGGRFKNPASLRQHKKVVCSRSSRHCDECQLPFTSEFKLKAHVATVHNKSRWKCLDCQKHFCRKFDWNRHMSACHVPNEKRKKHTCTECGATFGFSHNLNIHMKGHTGVGLHPCSMCDRRFVTKSVLRNHMTIHNLEKEHACSVCHRRFGRKGSLRVHMKIHGRADESHRRRIGREENLSGC